MIPAPISFSSFREIVSGTGGPIIGQPVAGALPDRDDASKDGGARGRGHASVAGIPYAGDMVYRGCYKYTELSVDHIYT